MRRVAGLIMAGLGAFLIVLALLIRFVVVGEVVKFPLNENTITTLTATNASYFSPAKLAELSGVSMEDTITVQGDNAAGNSSRAVWTEFSYVYDKTNGQSVQYGTQRLAFDRRTGVLLNCCGAFIGTSTGVHFSGQGYVWPLGAQEKTYPVFDTTLLKPVPAVFSGSSAVDGLTVYKYVQTVSATKVGTQTLPGTLVGSSAQSVTLDEYDQSTTTEYVDPTSGAPVEGVSTQHLYLVNSSGESVLNLLAATFTTTPASVASAVKTAKHYDSEISLVSAILPVVLGLVGIILLAMGLILGLSRTEDEYEDGYEEEEFETGEVSA
jgi:Porin PorA